MCDIALRADGSPDAVGKMDLGKETLIPHLIFLRKTAENTLSSSDWGYPKGRVVGLHQHKVPVGLSVPGIQPRALHPPTETLLLRHFHKLH